MTPTDIATIIALLMGAFLGYLELRYPRAKTKGENKLDDATAASKVSEAWEPVVGQLQKQIGELTTENASLEKRLVNLAADVSILRATVAELRHGAQLLVNQIEKQGLVPVWRPTNGGNNG